MPVPCASNDGFLPPDEATEAWVVSSRTAEGSGCDEAALAEAAPQREAFVAASAEDVAAFVAALGQVELPPSRLGAREPAASAPIIAQANRDAGVRAARVAPAGVRSPLAVAGLVLASLLAALAAAALAVRRRSRKRQEAGQEAAARGAAPKSPPERAPARRAAEDRTEAWLEDGWSEGSASQHSWNGRASETVWSLPHEETLGTAGSFEVAL